MEGSRDVRSYVCVKALTQLVRHEKLVYVCTNSADSHVNEMLILSKLVSHILFVRNKEESLTPAQRQEARAADLAVIRARLRHSNFELVVTSGMHGVGVNLVQDFLRRDVRARGGAAASSA
eukprot:TRINITY_DN34542_c0_g1_i1.p2 TRINITY_DN34542_c0_g1~~TRINITY_DN34542_c0_g1_i1.p2  ORF type:complete len:121 (+),score=26.36 TRINITY_DN34542_c0_g1_i1:531-893(+)